MGHFPTGKRGQTLYGAIFVKGVPRRVYPFSCPSVSLFDLGSPFLHPDPQLMAPAARRSGQGWRISATARLVLDGSEHDGTVAVVGDDDIEGSPACGLRDCSRHILVCGGYRDPDHDAVMRIGSKLRGGGPILHTGMRTVVSPGTPPPRTRHRRPVANRADRCKSRQVFLCDLPFNVRDGGRRLRA
jgi:hypothetical protein